MKRARFSAGAERDLREARAWYAEQGATLDLAFAEELERAVDQICRFPAAAPRVRADIRRLSLQRFPYSVFYRERERDQFILAVIHQARHPARWPEGP